MSENKKARYKFQVGDRVGTFTVIDNNVPRTIVNKEDQWRMENVRVFVKVQCDCGNIIETCDPGQLRRKMLSNGKGGARCYQCNPVKKYSYKTVRTTVQRESFGTLEEMYKIIQKLSPLRQKWIALRIAAYKRYSANMRTPVISDTLLVSEALWVLDLSSDDEIRKDLAQYDDLGVKI